DVGSLRFWLFTPGHVAALDHFFEHLPVPKSIHRSPEAFVLIGHESAVLDQAAEGLQHQFLTFLDKIEDLVPEDEVAAIDPDLGFLVGAKSPDSRLVAKFDQVEIEGGMNRNEAGDLAALLELVDHLGQGKVGQAVAVICEKDLLMLDQMTH